MNDEQNNPAPLPPPPSSSSFIVRPSSFDPSLPPDPRAFFSTPALPDLPPPDPSTPSALDKLGSCPIPKYKFPLLGFLATVYEHVSTHARTTAPKP